MLTYNNATMSMRQIDLFGFTCKLTSNIGSSVTKANDEHSLSSPVLRSDQLAKEFPPRKLDIVPFERNRVHCLTSKTLYPGNGGHVRGLIWSHGVYNLVETANDLWPVIC